MVFTSSLLAVGLALQNAVSAFTRVGCIWVVMKACAVAVSGSRVIARATQRQYLYLQDSAVNQHAQAARRAFVDIVERGEATLNLAAAALHVAAEDDALVTHSAVELPVELFLSRLQRYADEIGRVYLPPLGAHATPEQQLAVVSEYLFSNVGFSVCGREDDVLQPGDVLDHPGVWEDARDSCVPHLSTSGLWVRFSPAKAGFTAKAVFYCRPRPAAQLLTHSPGRQCQYELRWH